ncbi:hypothetical protein JCM14124_02280 [Humidesulfovibrio idahonensis]
MHLTFIGRKRLYALRQQSTPRREASVNERIVLPGGPVASKAANLRATFVLCCLCFLFWACGNADQPAYAPKYSAEPTVRVTQYIFAPHPLMSPQKLAEIYGALLDMVNKRLASEHVELKLETSLTYAAFNEKLAAGKVHFALPNPYQTVLSLEHGYAVFGKMSRDEDFRGIILLRKNSPITTLAGLKGASVSFPAPTALAATMMPELFLREHGIDPAKDIVQRFVGTHDSAMLNVCLDVTQAACTSPRAWQVFQKERPAQARLIAVRWQTPALPNNGLVALQSVPAQVRDKVAQALFHIHETPEGRRVLNMAGVERFEPANDATFAPVRDFIARYTNAVREPKGLNE